MVTGSEGALIDRAERQSSQDRAERAGGAARATVRVQGETVTHAGQAAGGGRSLAALVMAWLTVLVLRLRGGRRG